MPDYHHEIKIERIACPLHVLQIKEGMKKIKAGETLRVISNAYVMAELVAAERQMGTDIHIFDENSEILVTK